MPILNADDLGKAFPNFGSTAGDAIATGFRAFGAVILNNAPNNRERANFLGVLAREFRSVPAMMEQESATRDKELAQAKLAELFPDGKIPGEKSDDPIIQMANALAALKAGVGDVMVDGNAESLER